MPKLNLTDEEFNEIKQKRREQEFRNEGWNQACEKIRAQAFRGLDGACTMNELITFIEDLVK